MIKNLELIKRYVPNFTLSKIKFLQDFHLQLLDEGFEKSSVLDISFIIIANSKEKYIAKFRFYNPQEIKLESGGKIHQVSLDIQNISERKWENLSFEVIDYETGDLHFYCSGAEVLSINKTYYND